MNNKKYKEKIFTLKLKESDYYAILDYLKDLLEWADDEDTEYYADLIKEFKKVKGNIYE